MREKPQRKRPNKKQLANQKLEKKIDRIAAKKPREKPSKIILSLAIMRLLKP